MREILAKAPRAQGPRASTRWRCSCVGQRSRAARRAVRRRRARCKDTIYGRRLVLFAPLYVSQPVRQRLHLLRVSRAQQGARAPRAHAGGDPRRGARSWSTRATSACCSWPASRTRKRRGFQLRARQCIDTIYDVKRGNGEIRRVNVNVAPLTRRRVPRAQGERHRHLPAVPGDVPPRDLPRRCTSAARSATTTGASPAMDRAMEAGIDDVGIGVLFGLFDWRFEILAHAAAHPRARARLRRRPAHDQRAAPRAGQRLRHGAATRRTPVSDVDFRKIVAILRLAVPYTGIIMSTRETANMRRETFALGISQISRRQPDQPRRLRGGRGVRRRAVLARRPPLPRRGHPRHRGARLRARRSAPACYRLGRTGMDFMDLAKPGDIKHHCDPNALSTFEEYLHRLRQRRDPRDRRGAHHAEGRGDGPGAPRAHGEDARAGARRQSRRALLTPVRRRQTITTTRRDHP